MTFREFKDVCEKEGYIMEYLWFHRQEPAYAFMFEDMARNIGAKGELVLKARVRPKNYIINSDTLPFIDVRTPMITPLTDDEDEMDYVIFQRLIDRIRKSIKEAKEGKYQGLIYWEETPRVR